MAGIKISQTQVIVGVKATGTEETLVHELLHTRALYDINVPGNMMHWTLIDTEINSVELNSFLYQGLSTVVTGTTTPTGQNQKQWIDFKR